MAGRTPGYFATKDAYKRQIPGRLDRRIAGRGRPNRRAPDPADPRTAHPPRQGHEQHLHRAGAARQRRRHVRRLSRAGRLARHCQRRSTDRAVALAQGLKAAGFAIAETPFFDTVRVPLGDHSLVTFWPAPTPRRINLRVLDATTRSPFLSTRRRQRRMWRRCWKCFGGKTEDGESWTERRQTIQPLIGSSFQRRTAYPDAPHFQQVPLRTGDAAVPEPAGEQRPVSVQLA